MIGAGNRATWSYGPYALQHPDEIQFIAVAEPDAERRARFASYHDIPAEMQFASWEELAARPQLARAAINCTQDRTHYASTLALLRAGYDVLLEKPIAPTRAECIALVEEAERLGRLLQVCHVLRFTAFFTALYDIVNSGRLGRIITIDHRENVSYWHMSHSFVRDNWRNEALSAPMILAKCCHDLDILYWNLGAPVRALQSFGSLIHFRPEHRVLRLVLIAHCRVEYFTMTHEVSFPIVRDITAVAAPTEPLRKPAWWDDPLTHPSQQQPIRSEYYGGVFTLSDHLEWLAQQNEKIAIIAESFRLPTHQRDPDRGARTVGEWLLSVQRHEPVQMELNENTVLIRYQERAELRRSEIAESVLEPLEARARSLGGLTLDEYAMLANALTPAQQRRLEQPKGFALRFNPTPLQGGVPALRFWANLTPEQRKTARERRPLPYEQLSTVQQRLFWDAMEWGLTRPNIPTGHLLKQLERLHDPAASGELAFFLDDWKSVAYRVSNGDITLVFEDAESYQQSLPNLPGGGAGFRMTALSLHTYQFHFGFDTQHAVIFPLVVEEPAPRPESSQ